MAQTFHELLLSLLPPGPYDVSVPAPGSPGTLHGRELQAYGAVLEDLDDLITEMLPEIFPGTSSALLCRWETLLDLHPASAATEAERQASVLAAWRAAPSQSLPFLENAVETLLGITAVISEYVYPVYGTATYGYPTIYVEELIWRFHVHLDLADVVAAGLGLADFQAAQDLIDRLKPAHTEGIVGVGPAVYGAVLTPYGWGNYA